MGSAKAVRPPSAEPDQPIEALRPQTSGRDPQTRRKIHTRHDTRYRIQDTTPEATPRDTIRYKIQYSSYEFENEHCDWQPGLEHHIKQKPDGIVLTSMYAMTDDKERRNELLNLALENSVELHFANELCFLKNKEDLNQINNYLNFALPKKDKHVWE